MSLLFEGMLTHVDNPEQRCALLNAIHETIMIIKIDRFFFLSRFSFSRFQLCLYSSSSSTTVAHLSSSYHSLSLVIFIDFNYDGKIGEKSHRSLDQVQYQDGVRARNSFTDSYGNPVAYDTLDDVDNQRPSNNREVPHQYKIPGVCCKSLSTMSACNNLISSLGYASGILLPHEIPSRSAPSEDEGRRINDDRIHFVDPLHTNTFQTFDKTPAVPSISLAAPGTDAVAAESQSPIDIPKPNIDLPETPETPIIDDPIDHVPPHPPQDVFLNSNTNTNTNAPPSSILEVPIHQDSGSNPLSQNLIPPSIPASIGVDIPRPNLDAHETPIDTDSDSPLNQGLLPPNSDFSSNLPTPSSSSFNSPNPHDGPVIITDDQIKFAPKPVNGLLPPKEAASNDIDFQSNGGVPLFTGTLTNQEVTTRKQFTPFPTPPSFQIPVQVIQTPPNRPNFIQPPKATNQDKVVNKYQGGFGGPPGILSVDNNQFDGVVPTQAASLPLAPSTTDKFNGVNFNFGGAPGVLSSNNNNNNAGPLPAASTTTQTFTQPAPSKQAIEKVINKYTGGFGGPPGILTPTA
jgi:hypothetical protein